MCLYCHHFFGCLEAGQTTTKMRAIFIDTSLWPIERSSMLRWHILLCSATPHGIKILLQSMRECILWPPNIQNDEYILRATKSHGCKMKMSSHQNSFFFWNGNLLPKDPQTLISLFTILLKGFRNTVYNTKQRPRHTHNNVYSAVFGTMRPEYKNYWELYHCCLHR